MELVRIGDCAPDKLVLGLASGSTVERLKSLLDQENPTSVAALS